MGGNWSTPDANQQLGTGSKCFDQLPNNVIFW